MHRWRVREWSMSAGETPAVRKVSSLPEAVIRAESLTKYYGAVKGVDSLDLEVAPGEVFGYLGPNGAGKTTTIRVLLGFLRPTSGKASVFGLDSWSRSVEIKSRVGYLPGEGGLYRRLTGDEHIRYVSRFNGPEAEAWGRELAARLELETERPVSDFSRGMKQKLAIVLALMKKPDLLIMDEPTNALDPLTQHTLYEVLGERRDAGATILFSSHNLHEVERIADRVGIIREGTIVATERMDELYQKRLHKVEVAFAGDIPDGLDRVPGIAELERETGDRAHITFKGDINPLVRYLAEHELAELSITHGSLEDIFLEYYGGKPAGGGEGEAAPEAGEDR